jgi:hypothetical protein
MAPPTPVKIGAEIRKFIKSKQEADNLLHPQPVTYARVPNIQIGFDTGLEKWLAINDYSVYEALGDGNAHRDLPRHLELAVHRFKREADDYLKSVTKQLEEEIWPRLAGKALLAEINASKTHSLLIRPYEGDDTDENAEEEALDDAAATANGMPILSTKGKPTGGSGLGTGSNAIVKFSPSLWHPWPFGKGPVQRFTPATGPGSFPDEVLFHELVHACRDMRGVSYSIAVNRDYDNEEEYIAVVLTNIYLSNKRQTRLRANHHGFRTLDHANEFLKNGQHVGLSPRTLLARFYLEQRSFFNDLSRIPEALAPFNPVRQFDDLVKSGEIQCTASRCGPDGKLR